MTTQGYEGPPIDYREPNLQTSLLRLAQVVLNIMRGRTNNTGTVTLTASAASTTITDSRIAYNSLILFAPVTANAAAEQAAGTMYYLNTDRVNGSLAIVHANNAQTDRTFQWVVIG